MRRTLLWLPLTAFAVVLIAFAAGLLKPADRTIRSHLVGRAMPTIGLAPMVSGKPGIEAHAVGQSGPRLVNVFASWCVPCAVEAPQLMALQRRGLTIDAIAIRDRPEDVKRFLALHGDPFDRIGDDPRSQVQIALGSSGVPESFLVDSNGIIRFHHVGEIRAEHVNDIVAAFKAAR